MIKKGLHYRHGFNIGTLGLSLLGSSLFGFAASMAIAQTPPDVVIESEPTSGSTTTTDNGDRRFVCQLDQGRYTVMYQPESRPGESYAWAIPQTMGGGWTADRRCAEIARRLEVYRGDGLVELTTGIENNYNTVCVTTEANNTCQIVFTVPIGQDPIATRDSVFNNLSSADSGIQTQGVNTFTGTSNSGGLLGQIQGIFGIGNSTPRSQTGYGRSSGINLKPFLDRADGGTGEMLTSGQSQSQPKGRQLNPNIFR